MVKFQSMMGVSHHWPLKTTGNFRHMSLPYFAVKWFNSFATLVTLSKYILIKVPVVFLCFHFEQLFSTIELTMVGSKFFFSNYFKDVLSFTTVSSFYILNFKESIIPRMPWFTK